MINTEKILLDYNKMSYNNKRKKVLIMLETIKEQWNVFENLYKLINEYEDIWEDVINTIHNLLVKAMYKVQSNEMENMVKNFENLQNKLDNIKDMEKKEKENADDIIKNI